jgi:hypothetical protein
MQRNMVVEVKVPGLAEAVKGFQEMAASENQAAQAASNLGQSVQKARFMAGPNQKLLQIGEQRGQAQGIEDVARKQAILADLQIAEARAKRSQTLGNRLVQGGEDAIKAPGLLETTRAIQQLLSGFRQLASGNLLGAVQSLGHGAQTLGGLNVQQKAATGQEALAAAGQGAGPSVAERNSQALAQSAAAMGVSLEELAPAAEGATAALVALGPPGWIVAGILVTLAAGFVAVGVVLKGVYDAASQAAAALKRVYDAALLSGGSAGDVAGLARFGLGPGEAGGLANAFRRATDPRSASPGALLALSQLGMTPQAPAEFGGPVNNTAMLNQALERFRSRPLEEQQRMAAAIPELQAVLAKLNVSPGVQDAQKQLARTAGAVDTDKAAKDANSFTEALDVLGKQFDFLKTAAGEGSIKPIINGLIDLGEAVGHLARNVAAHPEIMRFLGTMVEGVLKFAGANIDAVAVGISMIGKAGNAVFDFAAAVWKAIKGLYDFAKMHLPGGNLLPTLPNMPNPALAKHGDALDKNTRAVEEQTRWMRETVNGGGDRVRGAQPAGLRGQALADWLKTQRLYLGAFSL